MMILSLLPSCRRSRSNLGGGLPGSFACRIWMRPKALRPYSSSPAHVSSAPAPPRKSFQRRRLDRRDRDPSRRNDARRYESARHSAAVRRELDRQILVDAADGDSEGLPRAGRRPAISIQCDRSGSFWPHSARPVPPCIGVHGARDVGGPSSRRARPGQSRRRSSARASRGSRPLSLSSAYVELGCSNTADDPDAPGPRSRI